MSFNFKNKLFLAPMAEITSSPFRLLCKKYGADVVCTELVSVNAIVRENERSDKLLNLSKDEKPIGVQLFGSNTEIIINAAKIVSKLDFDFVDFNLGCPSGKILDQGAGAALVKRKSKVEEILRELVKVCDSANKPVSVKIRGGVDNQHINYLEIGKIAEDCGVSAITLHTRVASQGYSGDASKNWAWIKKLKEEISIPVIGNGDVKDGKNCVEMYNKTKCDSVMIGRAAIGYPFIFREVKSFLNDNKEIMKASVSERLNAYLSIGGKLDFNDAKRQALWFTTGIDASAQMRFQISSFKNYSQIEKYFNKIITVSDKKK